MTRVPISAWALIVGSWVKENGAQTSFPVFVLMRERKVKVSWEGGEGEREWGFEAVEEQ